MRVDPHDSADIFSRNEHLSRKDGLADFRNRIGGWEGSRVLHIYHGAIVLDHLIAHVGYSGNDLKVMLAFKALLDDFHMQQPQVATAEAKAKCHGSFRLKGKCRVVETETFKRMTFWLPTAEAALAQVERERQ